MQVFTWRGVQANGKGEKEERRTRTEDCTVDRPWRGRRGLVQLLRDLGQLLRGLEQPLGGLEGPLGEFELRLTPGFG